MSVTTSDNHILDLENLLVCKICKYYYDKEDKTKQCGICDYQIPLEHYDVMESSSTPIPREDDCYFSCSDCNQYFCASHLTNNEYMSFTVSYVRGHGSRGYLICQQCFLSEKCLNNSQCRNVYIGDAILYINKIQQENEKLRSIVQAINDYKPGGEGYVEAKIHYDALLKT